MKLFRKIVDERQELEMMRVERGSFWVMLLALVVAILVQLFALGYDFEHIAGEFIVLVIGAVWSTAGYLRRGSWDYFTKPGVKTYALYSLAAGIIFGLVAPLTRYFRYGAPLLDCLRVFVINFTSVYILAFLTLLLLGTITKKRQKKLQQEYKEDK